MVQRALVEAKGWRCWWKRCDRLIRGDGAEMTDEGAGKAGRERAKELAEQRRAERRLRKRHCVLCGVEESDKTPLGPHPDGIGPACKDELGCQARRRHASG